MYVTYGILDPQSLLFVYVGQTNNLERRQNEHLMAHRERGRPKKGSLQQWLKRLNRAGGTPVFITLEVVDTEAASLASELEWIQKLGEAGMPLLNRWEEHKDYITATLSNDALPPLRPLLFHEKGKGIPLGTCKPNRNKTGYRLKLSKGVQLEGGQIIDLLPPKESS